jgi:pimeloyl-ACP methyl ester carboxylesterase
MAYWIGLPQWWLMPRKARESIVATVGKVAAEFAMIEAMQWRLTDYARVGARTRLIMGERSPKGAKAVIDVLGSVLPRAHTRVVKGAGHMSPVTHREEVALMMARHIDECRIAASLALVPATARGGSREAVA